MTQHVGHIGQLWQYPVKSMAGHTVESAYLATDGMEGDRYWAVREEEAGQITVVRRIPKLLQCSARFESAPSADVIPPVHITLPDGEEFSSAAADAHERLSEFLGKPVTIWPKQPRSNWKHYRLAQPAGAREVKRQFASKELPDLSSISLSRITELMIFATPLGRYHDVYPLHILSSGAIAKMREIEPDGDFRVERFRPNLYIESAEGVVDFDDFSWVGGTLKIGEVTLRCESRTVRCSAPAQPQVGLAKDAKVIRALEAGTGRHLGINVTVVKAGRVQVGDEVTFEPGSRKPRSGPSLGGRLRNRLLHGAMELTDKLNKEA